ncbi:HNH endonuclease [Tropicimonas sp. IMCC34011]|uniref:HNH endonuclease n=1 Tax=Tropicimonas sp. IMCC34011 TaxID=2248759 RepID=UPI000E239214|nr:HNH endonuclease [Tropicimonas sp. IMCC34011]
MSDASDPICPLCLRPIPPGVRQSRHHLVPRLRGGKGGETVLLHQICHSTIHAHLSETDLARSYATPEALRAHPEIGRFAAWVARRPPDFYAPQETKRRARRR